ncbi:MAG: NUDIX hydrolase [Thermoleophilia bacterium]|nr:NUDIX hydrolase [Thermoleophilia bacterium]
MLIRHPESVAIVPVDGDELVCVRQTRRGAGRTILELPSGKLEPGERPAEAAVRELAEECALGAREWRALGSFWAAPAYSTEFVHAYVASGLYSVSPRVLDPDEDIEVARLPLGDGLRSLQDAVSAAAFALWREAR